jgi:hypothetical protein
MSERFDGLAFPFDWEMFTKDYIRQMGFIGATSVLEEKGRQRRVVLKAASLPNGMGHVPWAPPSVVFDLAHDGWDVTACNLLVTPEVDEVTLEPSVERCVGAITHEIVTLQNAGAPISEIPQYDDLDKVAGLALSASAVLLNAAAVQQ